VSKSIEQANVDQENSPESSQLEVPTSELVARIITYCVVVGSTLFLFIQLHPSLLFSSSTDVGGDNAAHVVANYYFVHDLFPHLQLSGWDPEWFGGFPLYVFYFPLPAVLTAILTPVVSFSVAFKLITVLGSVLLPTAGYLFGRLCGFARPVPALMSAATLAYLFNTSYTIDGGNLASTLAGEYSFSLSLVFALLFLGMLVYSLRTGKRRWVAPILFALTLLCHVVPALFATGAAVIILIFWPGRARAIRIIATVGVVGALLSAFWLLRFYVDLPYSSSMGYTKAGDVLSNLFPSSGELAVQILAFVGLAYAFVRGQRIVLALCTMALGSVLAFAYLPSGLVYNARWLPFWFLTTTLIAAYAIAELGASFFSSVGFRWLNSSLTPAIATLATISVIAAYLGILPLYATAAGSVSFVPTWVTWNYTGYQGKTGWSNFQSLIAMLDRATNQYGCGRLDYEYSANFNTPYGSTLVPMSFPMWTNGCVASSEGVYYESSTSNPFHFLDQSELSIVPSNPVVGLPVPYQPLNVADGIRHLALAGVQYFLANSVEVEQQANADPQLTKIAQVAADPSAVETSPGLSDPKPEWMLYLIHQAPLVRVLHYQPVVEANASKAVWLSATLHWYQTESDWPVVLTKSGPSSWKHAASGSLVTPKEAKAIPATQVSDVTTTNDSMTFKVSRIGVPVVVNIPYFPNWSVNGATGPYLGSPNMMVVVPTSHTVSLHYGTTTVDWVGRIATVIGLIALFGLRGNLAPDPYDPERTPKWVTAINTRKNRREDEQSPELDVDLEHGTNQENESIDS
jgi:hypothetical protein